MTAKFIHLHLHSEYSLIDSSVRIKALVKAAAAQGAPAVALTDHNNMFGLVKFYRAARAAGIKPIIGADIKIHDPALGDDEDAFSVMTLLCMNDEGYTNVKKIISRGYLEGQAGGEPVIEKSWIDGLTDGVIALSCGARGPIGRFLVTDKMEAAAAELDYWKARFPDAFYLELHRTGRPGDEDCVHGSVALAQSKHVPVVASNDVCFLTADDFEAHEVRVCIHDGYTLDDKNRPRRYSNQQYLRTVEEMVELFDDIPEAIANTEEIAKRCNVSIELGKYYLPDFDIPDGMSMDEFFTKESYAGLEVRLNKLFDSSSPEFPEIRKTYEERLQIELDVINQMGFPGYFLIVADFIGWAKENDVPVGPGRGSGAGSLVAYALRITDLDPLKYDLLFERFLNPERVSMPDFDVDFCMEGRDRVIDYVAEKYGRDRVSQIATHGTMAAKAVVRDVGRVLAHPYGFIDRIAKLIPFEIGMTLTKALEQEEELSSLRDSDEEVKAVLDMALQLEGLSRNVGKHAGGVVISPTDLTDFTPIYREHGATGLVSQFDKDDVESVGLVKFDFLGLRTLTIINWALITANEQRARAGDEPIDIETIPLDDKPSFDLLKKCETTAVFQLESRGMKELIKRLQPDCFEDIVALVALFRPGPLQSGMVDDFIDRKHGRAKVEYPHPSLEPILEPTYGVILYQEQVMQIAQVLALYSLGAADLLRRAMGKKKPEEMAKQRKIFEEGSEKNNVDAETATYIFDLMEKFAGYGFNKSHSAAYALVAFQTAWLKAHYPAAFMAAVLSSDMDNTDKVVIFIEECRSMKLAVSAPDVNTSLYRFTVNLDGDIVYGLGAIKGVGQGAIESIVEEREKNGPYKDLFDFCTRIDLKKVNKRVLEALVKSGSFDSFGMTRASVVENLPAALKIAEQNSANQAAGQTDLFGLDPTQSAASATPLTVESVPEWPDGIRLASEKEVLGLYLTGHPITEFLPELKQFTSGRLLDIINNAPPPPADKGEGFRRRDKGQSVVAAGLIIESRARTMNSGARLGILTLDDKSARIEVVLYSEAYQTYRDSLKVDSVVIVEGKVSYDDFSGGYRINAECIHTIEQAREVFAKRVVVDLNASRFDETTMTSLRGVLDSMRGGECRLRFNYSGDAASASILCGDDWRVGVEAQKIEALSELIGPENVSVEY